MLKNAPLHACIRARDMARAGRFYEQTPGFAAKQEVVGGVINECANQTACFMCPTPNAGTSRASQAFWEVEEVGRGIDDFKACGVAFETCDVMPGERSASGAISAGGGAYRAFSGGTLAQPVPATQLGQALRRQRAPLDEALTFLEDTAREILPPGYGFDYTGESRQLRTEGNKFLPAFSLAVLMIFLVLTVQFNSFRDPFVILFGSVPLAMFGALIFTVLKIPDPNTPYWTHGWTTTMNIYAQVGLVTLVGLIAKNGILIVEFANHLQEQGASKLDAVHSAAMIRLRPVLMTSVATIAGHFPLVLVGGMAIGTLFTLFIVPSLYVLMAKNRHADQSGEPETAPPETPSRSWG